MFFKSIPQVVLLRCPTAPVLSLCTSVYLPIIDILRVIVSDPSDAVRPYHKRDSDLSTLLNYLYIEDLYSCSTVVAVSVMPLCHTV